MDIKVGIISNYFNKLGVAVLKIEGTTLKIGDEIRIEGRDLVFTQRVSSMQIEHSHIEEALPGQTIGLKVIEPVKKGAVVFKIFEGR